MHLVRLGEAETTMRGQTGVVRPPMRLNAGQESSAGRLRVVGLPDATSESRGPATATAQSPDSLVDVFVSQVGDRCAELRLQAGFLFALARRASAWRVPARHW